MLSSAESGGRIGPATFGSIALHVLMALSIPALAWTATNTTPIETVSFQRIPLISIRARPLVRPERRPIARVMRPTPVVVRAVRRTEVTVRRAAVRIARPTRPMPRAVAPTVAAVVVAGHGSTATGATDPAVTASPAPQQIPSTTHAAGGYLPFGADQPDPILDPAVRQALVALGVHTTLTITVGDNGKTQSVGFNPLPDAIARRRIEALLAEANWDPAVCGGGVTCRGITTIQL